MLISLKELGRSCASASPVGPLVNSTKLVTAPVLWSPAQCAPFRSLKGGDRIWRAGGLGPRSALTPHPGPAYVDSGFVRLVSQLGAEVAGDLVFLKFPSSVMQECLVLSVFCLLFHFLRFGV